MGSSDGSAPRYGEVLRNHLSAAALGAKRESRRQGGGLSDDPSDNNDGRHDADQVLRDLAAADRGPWDLLVDRWLARAHTAWPATWITDRDFITDAAERIGGREEEVSVEGWLAFLDTIVVEDLYLACACARGIDEALVAFGATYAHDIRRLLGGKTTPTFDELWQEVHDKLFVAGERTPRINDYSGRSQLKKWLRVVATRIFVDLKRRAERRPESHDEKDAIWELSSGADNPELDYLKRTSFTDFKRAFEDAVADLRPDERLLLYQHYVDNLTLEQMAGLYHVHRVTITRRLAKIRQVVIRDVRRAFHLQQGMSPDELENLANLIRSRLDLSLTRVLRKTPPR